MQRMYYITAALHSYSVKRQCCFIDMCIQSCLRVNSVNECVIDLRLLTVAINKPVFQVAHAFQINYCATGKQFATPCKSLHD